MDKVPLAVFDRLCYNKMKYADNTVVSLPNGVFYENFEI